MSADILDENYEERKYLRIVPDDYNFEYENIINYANLRTLLLRKKPKKKEVSIRSIKVRDALGALFPGDGMPKVGSVYICNPIDTRRYYNISNFHEEMRNHKLMEAQYLLRSLGATRIEIFTEQEEEKEKSFGFKSSYKDSFESSGGFNASSNNQEQKSYKATYNPSGDPFVPTDLYWYDNEPQWETIAADRLHHGLTSFELEIEVTSNYGVNTNLINSFSNKKSEANSELNGNYKKFKKQKLKLYGEFSPLS